MKGTQWPSSISSDLSDSSTSLLASGEINSVILQPVKRFLYFLPLPAFYDFDTVALDLHRGFDFPRFVILY